MSAARPATRCSSRSMVSGRSRTVRRARYCSSAWFFFRTASLLDLGVGLGQRQHGRVARGDGLDLGVGELLAADVLGAADGGFAGHHLGDEPGLGLQGLPHIGVERSFGDVAVDRHFLVARCPGGGCGLRAARPRPASTGRRDDAGRPAVSGRWCRCPSSACCRAARGRCRCAPGRTAPASWRRCRRRRWRRSARGGCRARSACR